MFIVLLKFSKNKKQASENMDGHKDWIERGIDEGVFLLVGSLQPQQGGCIIAHNSTKIDLETRLKEDPFVIQDIVTTEILELSPAQADQRLNFLLG